MAPEWLRLKDFCSFFLGYFRWISNYSDLPWAKWNSGFCPAVTCWDKYWYTVLSSAKKRSNPFARVLIEWIVTCDTAATLVSCPQIKFMSRVLCQLTFIDDPNFGLHLVSLTNVTKIFTQRFVFVSFLLNASVQDTLLCWLRASLLSLFSFLHQCWREQGG